MKITFVLPNLARGGGARVVFNYGNLLASRGHEVFIVYPQIPSHITNVIREWGAKHVIKKALIRNKKPMTEARLIKALSLSPIILNSQIPNSDAVIATEYRTAKSVNGLNSKKGEKFHLVQHYEAWRIWNSQKCWRRAEKLSEVSGERADLAMADIYTEDLPINKDKKAVDGILRLPLKKITISTWLKELIEKKFSQKVESLVINGVNLDEFYNAGKTYNKRKRVLAPFRDTRWKGAEDAIKAFEIIKERYPDVQFVMFGFKKGEVPDWVEFHENPSPEELRALYSSCDIFLYPSWVEGFGLPQMEAMACKCAVVSTNVGAVPDYSIPGETILTVPPRKPELLAEKAIELLRDEDKLQNLSEAGHEHIRQFTWEKAVDKFEHIIGGRKT